MCIHYNGLREVLVIWPVAMVRIMLLESTCLTEATHMEKVSCLSRGHEQCCLEIELQMKPRKASVEA